MAINRKKNCISYITALSAASLIFLSGCGAGAWLFPVEEEVPPPPVLRPYEKTDYSFVKVQRGDLVKRKNLSVNYMPARYEDLKFTLSGVLYDTVYVNTGDSVKAGQIVAELDKKNLETSLDETENNLQKTQLSLKHLNENYELDSSAVFLKGVKTMTAEEYTRRRDTFLSELEALTVKAEDLKRQIGLRILRASMDGTVSYCRTVKSGDRSSEGETIITVSDKSLSIFVSDDQEYIKYLKVGDAVTVTVSGSDDYDAKVVSPESIGIKVKSDAKPTAYITLNDLSVNLKDGSYGTVTLAIAESKDTLYLPDKAVSTANGRGYVYVLADGIMTAKPVEVGLQTDEFIEITSGLAEGDAVIWGR